MEDIDVWRTAQQMIALYDEDASVAAALRLDEFRESGDRAALAAWNRIIEAIVVLEEDRAPAGTSLN